MQYAWRQSCKCEKCGGYVCSECKQTTSVKILETFGGVCAKCWQLANMPGQLKNQIEFCFKPA